MAVLRALARPYAKAILALSTTRASQQQWHNFLKTASGIKSAALVAALQEILSTQQYNLLNILVTAKKLYLLPEIAKMYYELCLILNNNIEATLTTAITIDNATKLKFTDKFAKLWGKQVILKCKTAPKLLGGFIIENGSDIIDSSIQTALKSMQQTLMLRG